MSATTTPTKATPHGPLQRYLLQHLRSRKASTPATTADLCQLCMSTMGSPWHSTRRALRALASAGLIWRVDNAWWPT